MMEERIEQEFETGPQAEVRVENVNGSVTVEGWDEAHIRAELIDGELHVDADTALALAPGVELVRPEHGDATYILVDDTLRFVLDEPASVPWRAILRRLDGVAPLSAHLAAVGAPFEAIAALADEALRFGVVAVA